MVWPSGCLSDLDLDAAIRELLLADLAALSSCFDFCFLDRVTLQQPVEMDLGAPGAVVIVELGFAGCDVNDDRIQPIRKLHEQAGNLPTVEFGRASDRRRQPQPTACRCDRGRIAQFRLNGNDVAQRTWSSLFV